MPSGKKKSSGDRPKNTSRLSADVLPHLRDAVEPDIKLLGHDGQKRVVSFGALLVSSLDPAERRTLMAAMPVRGDSDIVTPIHDKMWPVQVMKAFSALKPADRARLVHALDDDDTRQTLLDWLDQ